MPRNIRRRGILTIVMLETTPGHKHQRCHQTELTLRHCSARHEEPQNAAPRLRRSGLVRCAHAALLKLTHWVLAFTEVIIGSAARAPSLISTSPVDNQDTLRADCPGTRSTVNVFPPTFLGRAPNSSPCEESPSPLQIPAFPFRRENDPNTTSFKVCAFAGGFILRSCKAP